MLEFKLSATPIPRRSSNHTEENVQKVEFRNSDWIRSPDKQSQFETSQFKRLWDKKQQQLASQSKSIDVIESKRSQDLELGKKRIVSGMAAITYSDDSGAEDDRESPDIDASELFNLQPSIENPFIELQSTLNSKVSDLSLWKTPEKDAPFKGVAVRFEKPSAARLTFNSPTILVRLRNIIENKDRQIDALRKQLTKINKEAAKLTENEARHKGPDNSALHRQNQIMKEQVSRCMKEIAVLKGKQMALRNTTIKRMKQQDLLKQQHSVVNLRSALRVSSSGARPEPPFHSSPSSYKADSRAVMFMPASLR